MLQPFHMNIYQLNYHLMEILEQRQRIFLFGWSYQDMDNMLSRTLLGNFTYNAQGEPLQIFHVQHWDSRLTNIIELETLTNWGSYLTCLYRFRVHGDALKIIPDISEETDDEKAKRLFSNNPVNSNEGDL
ncbi:unnamed protein product [Meloidogyne enterolobii]|uniref:Uncharacterized protein n=1 Tax=Meloidogyne enterolobii TaxID=390850 RepID=A0ACB0XSL0_MELEN